MMSSRFEFNDWTRRDDLLIALQQASALRADRDCVANIPDFERHLECAPTSAAERARQTELLFRMRRERRVA